MKAKAKGEVGEEESKDKKKLDKKNLASKRAGLEESKEWVHAGVLSEFVSEQRKRMIDEKEESLKKNPNLLVSKTRISLRNLPKKEFFEPELKDLMRLVVEEYLKETVKDEKKVQDLLMHKKFIK
eukprot:CAMPEP_0202969378 /NCGR_PEP_ID=MMETSP1396-20130829/15064_1 /ASSEMBLY_ACC=CAM_ASM_000872 /TAXON_ID= /ORGANISM="Pseudokeronopsis sp., Strain Brazil" /LENGTH=124 /DNA_ID=CAMNT_0049696817 /DNA_START=752 /DNA_END=1126 /DNA_ORIENTATION=+